MSHNNKIPAYLLPLYPFRAVGEELSLNSLEDCVLYELKCPNPQCVFCIRTQGVNVPRLYEKIQKSTGCPACKMQFGENEEKGYVFKKDEIEHPIPENNGHWSGFVIRRVIYVPKSIFSDYAENVFNCSIDQLDRGKTDYICELFYAKGNWREAYEKKILSLNK